VSTSTIEIDLVVVKIYFIYFVFYGKPPVCGFDLLGNLGSENTRFGSNCHQEAFSNYLDTDQIAANMGSWQRIEQQH